MSMAFMALSMTGGMILLMLIIHNIRRHHNSQQTTSGSRTHGVFPIVNWGIQTLLRLGIRITLLGPMMLLTVRGRKTGQPRTIAVDVHEHNGRRFLIATHGEGNWVRNLRAAREGVLSIGRKRQAFTSVELSPEHAGEIIKDVLGPLLASQGVRGSMLRRHLGLTASSPLDAFITVARSHPVFELDSLNTLSSAK